MRRAVLVAVLVGAIVALVALVTMACSTGTRPSDRAVVGPHDVAAWIGWHDQKRAEDSAIGEALNRPDGSADYPTAIALTEASRRPAGVIDLQVGNTILTAYRAPEKAIMPRQPAIEGIRRLERAAAGSGEGARTAPGALARWFSRGAGAALLPNPVLAACWQGVASGAGKATDCIAARRKPIDRARR